MYEEFITKFSSKEKLSLQTSEQIRGIIDYFVNNSKESDDILKSVISKWTFINLPNLVEFPQYDHAITFLHNYLNGFSTIALENQYAEFGLQFDYNGYLYNFSEFKIESDKGEEFIPQFIDNLQIAWLAYKWQELNGNLTGMKAQSHYNGSGEIFVLNDAKCEDNSKFYDFREKPKFEKGPKKILTLWEIYKTVAKGYIF
jgi:hypothetical protein